MKKHPPETDDSPEDPNAGVQGFATSLFNKIRSAALPFRQTVGKIAQKTPGFREFFASPRVGLQATPEELNRGKDFTRIGDPGRRFAQIQMSPFNPQAGEGRFQEMAYSTGDIRSRAIKKALNLPRRTAEHFGPLGIPSDPGSMVNLTDQEAQRRRSEALMAGAAMRENQAKRDKFVRELPNLAKQYMDSAKGLFETGDISDIEKELERIQKLFPNPEEGKMVAEQIRRQIPRIRQTYKDDEKARLYGLEKDALDIKLKIAALDRALGKGPMTVESNLTLFKALADMAPEKRAAYEKQLGTMNPEALRIIRSLDGVDFSNKTPQQIAGDIFKRMLKEDPTLAGKVGQETANRLSGATERDKEQRRKDLRADARRYALIGKAQNRAMQLFVLHQKWAQEKAMYEEANRPYSAKDPYEEFFPKEKQPKLEQIKNYFYILYMRDFPENQNNGK